MCCHTQPTPVLTRAAVHDYTGAHLSQSDWHELLTAGSPVGGRAKAGPGELTRATIELADILGMKAGPERDWWTSQILESGATKGTVGAMSGIASLLGSHEVAPVKRRLRKDSTGVTARELLNATAQDTESLIGREWLLMGKDERFKESLVVQSLFRAISRDGRSPSRVLMAASGAAVFFDVGHSRSTGVVVKNAGERWEAWPVKGASSGFGVVDISCPKSTWTNPALVAAGDGCGVLELA